VRSRIARASSLLALALAPLMACSGPGEVPEDAGPPIGGCKLPFAGDPAKEIEMDVIAIGPGTLDTLSDGSSVTLMFPPQGGRVIWAGVRARNVNPCAVRIAGALRDTQSQQVRLDNRIVNLEPIEDGWARTDPNFIDNFSNIPSCPNLWSKRDLFDVPYELTISLTDRDKRQIKKVLQVVPRCNEPGLEAECLCQCKGGYVLGESCLDEGAPDAGDDAGEAPDADTDGGGL
jgi:hypothetical protein